MIGSSRAIRVWARTQPTDLRNGFNGLYGLVLREFDQDPLGGDAFLFVNRRRTSSKTLLWDGTGLCIYAKRLSKGRFARLWPREEASCIQLTTTELALFLEGSGLVGKVVLSPKEMRLGS